MTITVYTKENCQQCRMTDKALAKAGIAVEHVSLDEHPEALQHVKQLGFMQAPVIETDTDAWAGFRPDKIAALASEAA